MSVTEDPLTTWDPALLSDEDVARVYHTIVSHPHPSREAMVHAGIEESLVDRAAVLLHSRGLLDATDPNAWEVPAPDIALNAWASNAERQARRWRTTAVELNQLYQDVRRGTEVDAGIRMLSSLSDIASASASVAMGASRQIVAFRANSRRTQQLLLDPYNTHREEFSTPAGHVLQVRAVYDMAILDVEGAISALHERTIGGEQVRLANTLPFSAVIADDTAAMIEFTNIDPSGGGSMLVRSKPSVTAVLRLADLWFTTSQPLPGSDDSDASQDSATGATRTRDALVLSLLAAGASDTVITRRLRISQRTVERRVRHLMDQLGAQTRFQAGVEAARRGLV